MWALKFLVYLLIIVVVLVPSIVATSAAIMSFYFQKKEEILKKSAEKNADLLARFADRKVASGQIFSGQEANTQVTNE